LAKLFEAVVAQLVRYLFGVNTLFGAALFKRQRERGAIFLRHCCNLIRS